MSAHPAKFSIAILERIGDLLASRCDVDNPLVLDPFAGTGRIHELDGIRSVGVEIEPEWAAVRPGTIVANALALPFRDDTFDGIITSPVYGNRHSDHHNARDGSRRHSYTHTLGRPLHPENSGALHWGDAYRAMHDAAWTESLRVLRPGGFVMVNVSNHIRKGKEQPVVEWHLGWFLAHGCTFIEIEFVETPRLRAGSNSEARLRHEVVFHLRYHPRRLAHDSDTHQVGAPVLAPVRAGVAHHLDAGEGGGGA